MRPTDGRGIDNPENPHSFTLEEIEAAASAMNPGQLADAFAAWSQIASTVTTAGQQFETAIANAVAQHWEGVAADSAVASIRAFAARLTEFGSALGAQSEPLTAAADAAGKFKAAVAPSTEPTSPETRNAAEEQARDDMRTYYIQPYGATAPTIPTLPAPLDIVVGVPQIPPGTVPAPGLPSTGPASTDSGTRPAGTAPAETTTEGAKSEETTPDSEQQPERTDPAKNGAEPAATAPAAPAATTPAATTPPATFPATAFTPATPATTTSGPAPIPVTPATADRRGTPTAPVPSAAAPSGTMGRPDPATGGDPRPGTTRPAQPGLIPGAQPAATAAAAARAGTAAPFGYPGYLAPGARANGTDDAEHKTPKYLRHRDNATDLIGTVTPTVPPVLGADARPPAKPKPPPEPKPRENGSTDTSP